MNEKRSAGNLPLLAGQLCLDFTNTVDWRLGDRPEDLLASYADLIAWSRHAGILSAARSRNLLREAGTAPAAAAAAFKRAIALRELIYSIFSRVARGRAPGRADVAELNCALSDSLSHIRLVPAGTSFEWGWEDDGKSLERPIWYLAQSAATLLTTGKLDRVRRCGDDRCGWLFFDMTKNRSRRWCSMEDCGNRAKARRHYSRSNSRNLQGR